VRIAEPEDMSIARQGLGKYVPMTTNTHATIELLEAVFSSRSVLRLYNEDQQDKLVGESMRTEA
jgi:hypothetical protein